jgi:hypothetical protein
MEQWGRLDVSWCAKKASLLQGGFRRFDKVSHRVIDFIRYDR